MILYAADSDDATQLPAMTDDLLNLLTAWYQWNQQDTHLAQVTLTANCGPVVVNDQLELSAANVDGKPVYGIRKNGLCIYWSDGQLLNQDGSTVTGEQQSPEDLAQLLDISYLVCQDGTISGISFDLGGSITVATFGADVSITGQITFQDGTVTIPEAVQKAICSS